MADGIYEKHGLDVTIRPGGPQVNHSQLLAAGTIDFNMGGGLFGAFNYVQNDIPMVVVAATFQKDPQILMAHPDQGFETLADLKGHPILISQDARTTFWQWLKTRYGYSDDQIRPYTFNPAPFLADPSMVQQGYVTSEPFAVEREGGFKPQVFLLADAGYDTYSTTIETSWQLVEDDPDLVQRFVDASIEGWYSYLYGDPAPANALIKADNPEMSDAQIAYSIAKLKEHGIVDAREADIEQWYVERFLTLRDTAFRDPSSFFRHFAALSEEESAAVARDIWRTINGTNLRENILPTRERAHLILEKAVDHTVESVRLRKI